MSTKKRDLPRKNPLLSFPIECSQAVIKKTGKAPQGKSKGKPPEQTFEEVRYLRYLIENKTRIRVRLKNNEEFSGTIEYYDRSFIRLTREDGPNLFLFKRDIKYLYEE